MARTAPSVSLIIDACAEYYGVAEIDIRSGRRTARVAFPRHAAMWLARKLTPQSLPEIGRRFGGRDHTTVMNSVNKMDEAKLRQPETAKELAELETIIVAASSALDMLTFKHGPDQDAGTIAQRLVNEPLARMQVSIDEIRTLALAVIRQDLEAKERARKPALPPAPHIKAAAKAVTAFEAWQSSRFSPRERYAQDDFERSMKALKTSLNEEGTRP